MFICNNNMLPAFLFFKLYILSQIRNKLIYTYIFLCSSKIYSKLYLMKNFPF